MTRLLSFALVLMLALSVVACGSDDEDEEPTIDNAETCADLMDAFMPVMQGVLDAVSDMSMAELMSEDEPEVLGEFEEDLDAIEAKSNELDCQDDELQALLLERVDQLTASGPVAELLLEMMNEESFFD
jgi:hypothetical protein